MPGNLPNIPERFRPSRMTLLVDRVMTYAIRAGGLLVVAAVFGIFVFIASQIWPLFHGAQVRLIGERSVPPGEYLAMGVDEWGEMPFFVKPDGTVVFVPTDENRSIEEVPLGLPQGVEVCSIQFLAKFSLLVAGTNDGRFALAKIKYRKDFTKGGVVEAVVELEDIYDFGLPGSEVVKIAYGNSDSEKLAVGILKMQGLSPDAPDQYFVKALTLKQSSGLMGAGKIKVNKRFDLTDRISGRPEELLVDQQAEGILVSLQNGRIGYFYHSKDDIQLRQEFEPFSDQPDRSVASINFILGDVSISLTNPAGVNRIFSLFIPDNGTQRLYGMTKQFLPLPAGGTFFSQSLRNKSYLIGSGSLASLRYSTTENIRWEKDLGFPIDQAVIGGKNDRLLFLGTDRKLHTFSLNDPHPEAGWRAFFGKIWYEGASHPKYEWQSTGGSDDFEPKLSMIPLLAGTLKGTLYAMLLSLPIALLAAIYTSQFLDIKIKRVVKPTMEIMASLPSVVLGFLAALWLAPLIETKVPSVLMVLIALLLSAFATGWAWTSLPKRIRRHIKPGWEFVAYFPVMAFACWTAWNLGPWVESWAFVITEPNGTQVADFRRWWPAVTGTPFEQRNSLVVGFMMGFAVIPIIFTIAEDALSNVPGALRSGSLALGASRWQTALYVVLPTASAGIFSAVMIGLGRAVGETMIVVMATGNTPVMEWNIFSGMRTLSANIAVELPEAPHHGTLFRALFLGAMLLFMITFFVNTIAELMRQHLRDKYKTI